MKFADLMLKDDEVLWNTANDDKNDSSARWYPQITHFNRVFHYKPSILGYHHLRKHLGGGNSNIFGIFIPILGEMIQFDEHIFQMGWFNHQPAQECPGDVGFV